MELQELQEQWGVQSYHKKNQDKLIVQLFKEARQNKTNHNLKKTLFFTLIFTIYNALILGYSFFQFFENFPDISWRIDLIVMITLSLTAVFMNLYQLSFIFEINHSKPIVDVQKLIGKLKIQRIKHLRFIFIFSHLYSWLLISLVFKWDLVQVILNIWEGAPLVVISQLSVGLLYFLFAFWLLKKYDSATGSSKFWKKMSKDSYLTDESVNWSLNKALSYLKEIEAFEKEEAV